MGSVGCVPALLFLLCLSRLVYIGRVIMAKVFSIVTINLYSGE